MIICEAQQGSIEWLADRAGVFSASNFDKLITTKGEASKQAQKYIYEIAAEKVSGIKAESFQSAAMARGVELENEAVEFYSLTHEVDPRPVGFVMDDLKRWGASPDRLINDNGLLEVKCPLPHTMVDYLLNENLYQDYKQQVQGQLFVTGREWCDLIAYSRGLKPLIIRVKRDDEFISKLESILIAACKELDAVVEKIK